MYNKTIYLNNGKMWELVVICGMLCRWFGKAPLMLKTNVDKYVDKFYGGYGDALY
jgi:hypothetical protein